MVAQTLRVLARALLVGVGDASLGEWEEWTGAAFHVKRRLTPAEAEGVGPVVDIRHLPEAGERLRAAARANPTVPLPWLLREIAPTH